MAQLQRSASYRLVKPSEIRDPLRDLRNVVVFLAERFAIDFAANGIRWQGRIIAQFTAHERLVLLYLCFWFLHKPEKWVHVEKLVDNIFPLPDGRDACSPHKPKHAIQQVISQIRRKLGEDQHKPAFLLCKRNLGYKLQAKQGYGSAFVRMYQEDMK